MYVTPFYAALLGLVFFLLSVRTIKLRRQLKIAIGAGGNPTLHRAMRVHGNFVEYTPFSLLLIIMLELQGAHFLLIHVLCLCLLVGRAVHAYGVSETKENYRYRIFGMTLTFAALVGAAACLLVGYILYLFV